MSEKLFNALETCLQALEKGETLDSTLTRFPDLAADLRPILETSLRARTLGGAPIPDAVQRRGRSRLLQRAAEMREAKRAPRRTWLYNFRPLTVALMLVIFFLSGTGLVRASSGALPGDNLYLIKRTWEDMRLFFTFENSQREHLEMEYENERVEEISELLAEGRSELVSFSGYITAQSGEQWTVSGITVLVTAQTKLPAGPVGIGSVITVHGTTNQNGLVDAQRIEVVPAGRIIPTPKPEAEDKNESQSEGEGSGKTSPKTEPSPSSEDDSGKSGEDSPSKSDEKSKIKGTLQSINGNVLVVNGQIVNLNGAEIVGTPVPGIEVTIEGYVDASGVFIATKVVFGNAESSGSSISSGDDSNDNSSDDSKDNDNSGDNDNDSGGGGNDNSSDDD